jgi:hypothetical protein
MPNPTRLLPALSIAVLCTALLLGAAYQSAAAQDGAVVPADLAAQQSAIRVNELMASNNNTLVDPDEPGETPDWIELYNPGPGAVSLDGLGLADGEPLESGFAISNGLTIPSGGFLVFYADSDEKQGPLHTDFALSADGESVILFNVATKQVIDRVDFPALATDQAFGRKPDGRGRPAMLPAPSPGSTNAVNPPNLSNLSKPPYPAPSNSAVAVSVTVTDTGTILGVTLFYSSPISGEQQVPMSLQGGGVYAAAIPPQPEGTLVTYYVEAIDNDSESARVPLVGRERRYLTGYVAPKLLINEVIVENSSQYVDPDEPAETPDWIEIYNPGPGAVSLNGLSITDDKDLPLRFVMPPGLTLGAGKRMMLLADDDKGQNELRGDKPPLHLPFNLNKDTAYVGLYGGQGSVRIDYYDIDDPTPFGLVARVPDGKAWTMSACPTFNQPNLACDDRVFAPNIRK